MNLSLLIMLAALALIGASQDAFGVDGNCSDKGKMLLQEKHMTSRIRQIKSTPYEKLQEGKDCKGVTKWLGKISASQCSDECALRGHNAFIRAGDNACKCVASPCKQSNDDQMTIYYIREKPRYDKFYGKDCKGSQTKWLGVLETEQDCYDECLQRKHTGFVYVENGDKACKCMEQPCTKSGGEVVDDSRMAIYHIRQPVYEKVAPGFDCKDGVTRWLGFGSEEDCFNKCWKQGTTAFVWVGFGNGDKACKCVQNPCLNTPVDERMAIYYISAYPTDVNGAPIDED